MFDQNDPAKSCSQIQDGPTSQPDYFHTYCYDFFWITQRRSRADGEQGSAALDAWQTSKVFHYARRGGDLAVIRGNYVLKDSCCARGA